MTALVKVEELYKRVEALERFNVLERAEAAQRVEAFEGEPVRQAEVAERELAQQAKLKDRRQARQAMERAREPYEGLTKAELSICWRSGICPRRAPSRTLSHPCSALTATNTRSRASGYSSARQLTEIPRSWFVLINA